MKNPRLQVFINTFLLVIISLCISGCATIMTMGSGAGSSDPMFNQRVAKADSIRAIGKLSASDSKRLGHENIVMLLGSNSTYAIFEGGDALLDISNNLNAEQLEIQTETDLRINGDKLWGTVYFRYRKPIDSVTYSAKDVDALKQARFTFIEQDDFYTRLIPITGC